MPLIEEEEINTDIPKEKNKEKCKKNSKNKLLPKNKGKQDEIEESNLIPNAIVLTPESLKAKLTKTIEEEEIKDSKKENKNDEFKIAKYFSQIKLS